MTLSDSFDAEQIRRSVLTRRQLLAAGGGLLSAGVLGSAVGSSSSGASIVARTHENVESVRGALEVLRRSALRRPGSLPFPHLAPGTDTMPGIEHFVVLMMENHSFDNLFGMLGRGDGFTIVNGVPTNTNPYANGQTQHAFHMPTTCQLSGQPSQEWAQSHVQYANGANNGFVISNSGPVSMGYWTGKDLPFTYSLASTFPIGDRYFCSLLGQTDPNRRYLIAATSCGMTDDFGTSGLQDLVPDVTLLLSPLNGTIFDRLCAFGISGADYAESFPLGSTAELYPIADLGNALAQKTLDQFFTDAAAGNLPSFSVVDMNYSTQSQENPQNIVVGEALMAQVVDAIGNSPNWDKTMLIINYDEHGGYYDHVPPPPALTPDLFPPLVQPGQSTYDGFSRYGFRVPSIVVSPYAKTDFVSHLVYDHTSVLATLERKWNLPALTYRDANANDLFDFIDLEALAGNAPTFPSLPNLAAPGNTAAALACSTNGPGTIPPAGSIS